MELPAGDDVKRASRHATAKGASARQEGGDLPDPGAELGSDRREPGRSHDVL